MADQQALWLQYMQALSDKINLGAGEALQVVYPYISWNWGGQSPIVGSFSYEAWMALNVVPSDPTQDSNSSAAASQSGFAQGYMNWINALAIGNLSKDAHYVQLQANVTNAGNTYTTDYDNVMNVWKNKGGNTSGSFAAWLTEPPQVGYATQLDEDKQSLAAAQVQLDNYRQQIESPVSTMTTQYNNTDFQGLVMDPNSGKSVSAHLWDTDPATPADYINNITGNNFGGNATSGNGDSFTFDQDAQQYSNSQVYGEAGGIVADFFAIESEGSFSQADMTSFSSDYTVEFSCQDLGTVTVTPEGWYSGTNVASYAAGPYATGFSEFDNEGGNYFFGPGGALSRIYTKLIVAYRPTVTITASQEFSDYMLQQWQQESGIEIGPFFFGGETSGSEQSSTASSSNGQFVIQSTANFPVIVGQVSAWTIPPSSSSDAEAESHHHGHHHGHEQPQAS